MRQAFKEKPRTLSLLVYILSSFVTIVFFYFVAVMTQTLTSLVILEVCDVVLHGQLSV